MYYNYYRGMWAFEMSSDVVDRMRKAVLVEDPAAATIISPHSSLLICNKNFVAEGTLFCTADSMKHVSRSFYVPYSCRDAAYIPTSLHLYGVPRGACLKIVGYPKPLEKACLDLIIEGAASLDLSFSPTAYTHVVHLLYLPNDAIFRWGVFHSSFEKSNFLTSEMISKQLKDLAAQRRFEPVSRAYFKMEEIAAKCFAAWQWTLREDGDDEVDEEVVAIDCGASPGGWTQCLLEQRVADTVLALDAGQLDERVSRLKGCVFVNRLIESSDCAKALHDYRGRVRLIVCDMNVLASEVLPLLAAHILPYRAQKAFLVLTLKFTRNPKEAKIHRIAAEAEAFLRDATGASDFRLLHLHANSRNERTLCCRL